MDNLPLSLSFNSCWSIVALQCCVSSLVLFSCSVMPDSLWPYGLQHARLPCPSLSPRVCSNVHWVDDANQPSHPLSSPSPHVFNLSQHQGLFQWVGSSYQVAKIISIYSNKPLWGQVCVCVCVCVFHHVPCSIPGGSVEQCLVNRRTSINICWISEGRRYLSPKCLLKIQSTF